jgi:uncharacterized membrane protein
MAVADQDVDPIFLSSDRLASLSDTMFGVAMTLLATTLIPSVQTLAGSALDMLRAISEPLTAVALSFAISGAYWISQQCRLAMTRSVTHGRRDCTWSSCSSSSCCRSQPAFLVVVP